MTASDPMAVLPSHDDNARRRMPRVRTIRPRAGAFTPERDPGRSSLWLGALVLGILLVTLAPLDLLLPKVSVQGVVLDRVSREPIGGARIRFGANALTSDRAGAFGLERASMTEPVQVEADGYLPVHVYALPFRQLQVSLSPRSLTLNLRDAETNEPVLDAVPVGTGIRFRVLEPGRLQVEPARDNVPLTIAAPGFQNTVIRHRDGGEATVALQPRVTGVVVDGSTGRTIPGAFVTSGDIALTTDANGAFELERRPPGPLRVLAPGYRRIDVDASQGRQIVARVEPIAIKALYLTQAGVGNRAILQNVLALAERTEVNAVVIDVKGERGRLSYRSDVPLAQTIGANVEPTVPNIDELLATLRQRGIYTVARIVVFKDDLLARNGQRAGLDVALRESLTNQIWTESDGMGWVDPFRPEVWEYNVDLAREAARKGFDEVQFDAARFPAEQTGGLAAKQPIYSRIWFTERDRIDTVGGFLRLARDQVRLAGAFISVDVQGYATWNEGDNGVGQNLELLASAVDYLCPTVHPSAFKNGLPGLVPFPQVVQQPYAVVFESLRRATTRTAGRGAVYRPWLQYFDDFAWQTGRQYRTADIDAQRNGAQAAGVAGWMMWDPSNRYMRGGLGSR